MSTPASSRRAGSVSPLRRSAQYAICVGIVLALASAFGSVWIVRAGLLAAVVGGVLALRFAWREVRESHTEHASEMNRVAHAQGIALTAERRRNAEVLDALREHNQRADSDVRALEGQVGELKGRVGQLEGTVGELTGEVDTLRGANAGLRNDLHDRDRRIAGLTTDLRAREAELEARREADEHAEVVAMPRHAATAQWDTLPTAEELFRDADQPTVVDLQKLVRPAIEAVRKQA